MRRTGGGIGIGKRIAAVLTVAMVAASIAAVPTHAADSSTEKSAGSTSLDFQQVPSTSSVFGGAQLDDVAANSNVIVIVGLTFAPGANHGHPVVFTSKTGVQWKQISDATLGIPAALIADWVRVTIGSKGFLVLTNDGDVLLSRDARTWTFAPDSTTKLAYAGEPLSGKHLIVYNVINVVATSTGYVASGQGCECANFDTGDHTPAVMTSTDGHMWSAPAPLDPGFHNDPSSLASGPNGLVLGIGGDPGAVYTSRDGKAWDRVDPSVFGTLGARANFQSVAASRAGYLVVGRGNGPDGLGTGPATVWHSSDGKAWTPVGAKAFEKPGVPVSQVVATHNGFIALGFDGHSKKTASWTSNDGISWRVGPTPPAAFTRVTENPRGRIAIVSDPPAVWVAGNFKFPVATSTATLSVSDFQPLGLDFGGKPTAGDVKVEVLETQLISGAIRDPSHSAQPVKPSGRFLAVRYRLTNNANGEVYAFLVSDSMEIASGATTIKVVDQGNTHPISDWQTYDAKRKGDKPPNSLHVQPGHSATTWVVYDIPKSLVPRTLSVEGFTGPLASLRLPAPKH